MTRVEWGVIFTRGDGAGEGFYVQLSQVQLITAQFESQVSQGHATPRRR